MAKVLEAWETLVSWGKHHFPPVHSTMVTCYDLVSCLNGSTFTGGINALRPRGAAVPAEAGTVTFAEAHTRDSAQ
jgi:hypothetical protein